MSDSKQLDEAGVQFEESQRRTPIGPRKSVILERPVIKKLNADVTQPISEEKQLDTIPKAHADQKLDLDECNEKLKLAEQYTNELQAEYKLQESVKRLEKENADLRRQRDTAYDEKDGLKLQVERRDTELERLRTEVNSRCSQLQAAVTAKCQALAQMEDTNAKAKEYTNSVKKLLNLAENAIEQYGILESKYNQVLQKRDEENTEKEQKINELGTELEHANELLKTLKQERLDLAVEQLAPTAAVTNGVLKKGLSLTQIYTQLVKAKNELSMEGEESEKLKALMEEILREIEEKTPILQQQHENYEAVLDKVTTLLSRLDELLSENHRLQEQTDEANRVTNIHTRENQTVKTQLSDIARQVCFLLKEVQESRTGNSVYSNDVSMEGVELTSSQIISKKLVTFLDIEELRENNQKLLTTVKSLSVRQEEIERATSEASCEEMKEKLDKYLEQLADMQASQDRQAKMFECLMKQRDMYKNMYHQCLTHKALHGQLNPSQEKETEQEQKTKEQKPDESSENSTQSHKDEKNKKEWERKLADSETRLKQITDDFETYKKEMAAYEKMLREEIDSLKKESESSSTRSCRLRAQLDSANERFHLLQANVASYKEHIKILEEKCNNYNTTIGKHEQSIMMLKDETLSAQAKLSRAEVQLDNLRQERQILKDSKSRLLKEREVMHRERQTQAVLKTDVELIKASLERVQVEGELLVEQRFDDATRECAALRRRLQEEQDRFRELGSYLKRRITAAEERLALTKRVNAELDEVSSGNQETDYELREKLSAAEKKLEELDELKGELELVKTDLQNATKAASEADAKYLNEMFMHSTDLQLLSKLKEEAQTVSEKIFTLTQERDSAVENLKLEKSNWIGIEQKLKDELEAVQMQVEGLNAQNTLLHSQIQEMSDRAAVLQSQHTKFGGSDSLDTIFDTSNRSLGNIEDDSKSHDQLVQLIRLMQKEKALNAARYNVLKAETMTLKSQVEVAERRLKETEAVLNSEREKLEINVVTASKHAELLRKAVTLNAITDSNRVLREERDILSTKVAELTVQVNAISEEVIVPLREKARDLEGKFENLLQENASLKGEATRWRQRANILVERANKASPEDWRRLLTERENLSKLLTSERETHAKMNEEFNALKVEKSRLDDLVTQLQKQVQVQSEQLAKVSEEARKLRYDLNEAIADSNTKETNLTTLRTELADKEAVLSDLRNEEMQIRKIAKKYKTQYLELVKSVQEEKTKAEELRVASANAVEVEMQVRSSSFLSHFFFYSVSCTILLLAFSKSRQQEVTPSDTQSASEIEYQVPTSSQRDQDEEGEDSCVVVVDCDEGEGGGTHQAQEEEFENDSYEEMEEEEELPYGVEGEGARDNNEVEIIMEEDPASVEVSRQAQPAIPPSQQQQQSEVISSAGPFGEPPSSLTRSSRGIAPIPRQQQQQHLLLPPQGYEDSGDDCIVPSTLPLFVPRIGDGFGEAVSSPQVPQGHFTFGEPNAPTTASSTPSLTTSCGSAPRTIFGTSAPGVAQVRQDGMDDARIDLTQLEDVGTGRSVPTTPLQVSPAAVMPPSTSSEPSEEQEAPMSRTNLERDPKDVAREECVNTYMKYLRYYNNEYATITESENIATMQGVSSEVEKQTEEAGASDSGTGDDDSMDAGVDASEESGVELLEDDAKEENRQAESTPSINTRQQTAAATAAAATSLNVRGNSVRRSTRSPFRTARGARPNPII